MLEQGLSNYMGCAEERGYFSQRSQVKIAGKEKEYAGTIRKIRNAEAVDQR